MVSSRLKKAFESRLKPGVRALSRLGLTPNVLTVLGLIFSFAAAWFYVNWRTSILMLPLAGTSILLSGFLDAIDGMLARETGKTSDFGGLLDSVSDRYSDAIVLSSILLAGLSDLAWGLTAIVGSLMVSYARARAEAAGVNMASVGLMERAERMLVLAASTFIAYLWIDCLKWGVIAVGVLSHVTVLQRTAYFHGRAK